MKTTASDSRHTRRLLRSSPAVVIPQVARVALAAAVTAACSGAAALLPTVAAQAGAGCVGCLDADERRELSPRPRFSRWRLTECVDHTLIFRELDRDHIRTFLPQEYVPFINATTGKAVVWMAGAACGAGSIDNGEEKAVNIVLVGPRINRPAGADPGRAHFYLSDLITDSGEIHGRLTAAAVDHVYTNDVSHSYVADPSVTISSLVAGVGGRDGFSSVVTASGARPSRPHSHLLAWHQNARRGPVTLTHDVLSVAELGGTGTFDAATSWIGSRLVSPWTVTERGVTGPLELDFVLAAR